MTWLFIPTKRQNKKERKKKKSQTVVKLLTRLLEHGLPGYKSLNTLNSILKASDINANASS